MTKGHATRKKTTQNTKKKLDSTPRPEFGVSEGLKLNARNM